MKNNSPSDQQFQRAIDVLRGGGIVAFPTETYYGLAVDIYNKKGVNALFQLKKRDYSKPILLLIDDRSMLQEIVAAVPKPYERLMRRFWPGPLTLIFPAASDLSSLLTGPANTIGVRISPHPVAMELCRKWGRPLTATSANISGREPAQTGDRVKEMFGDKIDYVLDGGETPGRKCSTVVGLDHQELTLIREGRIDFSEIISSMDS